MQSLPLLALYLPKSSTKVITHVLQIIIYVSDSGERNGARRRTKVSFCRTMMYALELLRLVFKAHLWTK